MGLILSLCIDKAYNSNNEENYQILAAYVKTLVRNASFV